MTSYLMQASVSGKRFAGRRRQNWGLTVSALWRAKFKREARQILWTDANDTATRTIQIRYEKERDSHKNRQNEKPGSLAITPSRSIAQQQI